ncbi:hypothetical protein [Streptomyces roseus]|nr:hypothetical protein [Streptomyces roseus]
MALIDLRSADAVDGFLSGNAVVLLFVGSSRPDPAAAVLASLCALAPAGRVAKTEPDAGEAEGRAREFLARFPLTDRASLVLMHGSTVLDVLRCTDVEAHGSLALGRGPVRRAVPHPPGGRPTRRLLSPSHPPPHPRAPRGLVRSPAGLGCTGCEAGPRRTE